MAKMSRSIRMLSLDGGTPEGVITQISMVQEIIGRKSFDEGMDVDSGELRPSDFFDIIGGTGLGGALALLFGHRKLTCKEARYEIEFLLNQVFVEPKEERESQATLQWVAAAIFGGNKSSGVAREKLDADKLQPAMERLFGDPVEVAEGGNNGGCVAVVFVRSTYNLADCRGLAFRNGKLLSPTDCSVVQAACATVSIPDLFPPTKFPNDNTFISAGLGSINPTRELIRVAESIYKDDRRVACIVNVGSGTRRAVKHRVANLNNGEDSVVDEITRSIEDHIAVDALRTSEELKRRLTNAGYFYLSVDSGLHDSKMIGWDLSTADQHADSYKDRADADKLIDDCVRDLGKDSGVPLRHLVQSTATGIEAKSFTKPPPHFVDPIKEYNQMYEALIRRQCPIAVVTGRLGCGKSLLSSYFAFREHKRYNGGIFLIDSNTAGDIRGDLQTAIRSLSSEYRHDSWDKAIRYFESTTESWLIIFDGVGDDVKIADFIPHNKNGVGKVIINGRNKMLGVLAPDAHIQMGSRSDRDAMKILEKTAHYETLIGEAYTQAHRLCRAVGCMPVVLVQAGSYCRRLSSYEEGAQQSFNFESYRKMYELGKQRWELLGEKAPMGMDGYNEYFMKTLEADMDTGKGNR